MYNALFYSYKQQVDKGFSEYMWKKIHVCYGLPFQLFGQIVCSHALELTQKNTMASKKYFDLSSYNMTTDWRRIELPFRRLAEDPEFYIFAAILLTALSAPLNFFLIIQILR